MATNTRKRKLDMEEVESMPRKEAKTPSDRKLRRSGDAHDGALDVAPESELQASQGPFSLLNDEHVSSVSSTSTEEETSSSGFSSDDESEGQSVMDGDSAGSLGARLATFLPQLERANEELAYDQDDHRIDQVGDDEEQYIEMDLGLGVLKEKRLGASDGNVRLEESSDKSSSDDESDEEEEAIEDVLEKMMGTRAGKGAKPVIQDLEEG